MYEKGKSSSLEFSIPLLAASQTRHLSHFWYKHTNIQHPQPNKLSILNLLYFHSLLAELILPEITDLCVHTHSRRAQQPDPGHPTAAVCTLPQCWCRPRELTQPHLGSLRIWLRLLL